MQELLDVDTEDITSSLCLGRGKLSTEASGIVSTQQDEFFLGALVLFHSTVTEDHEVSVLKFSKHECKCCETNFFYL